MTRKNLIGASAPKFDTSVDIPAGRKEEADQIVSEAKTKAYSGDPSPTEELALAYPDGWQRELYVEQLLLFRGTPATAKPIEAGETASEDVGPTDERLRDAIRDAVYRFHAGHARANHQAILVYRSENGLVDGPGPQPDISANLKQISDQIAGIDRKMQGIGDVVRDAVAAAPKEAEVIEPVRVVKTRRPSVRESRYGVDYAKRYAKEAEEVIAIGKSRLGNEEFAAYYDKIASRPWKAMLLRNVIKSESMRLGVEYADLAPGFASLVNNGAHLEAIRELSILTNSKQSLEDVLKKSQQVRSFVFDEMDNAATFEEILEMLKFRFALEEDTEGHLPRFFLKSAGLTLVGGVYMVQNEGSVH